MESIWTEVNKTDEEILKEETNEEKRNEEKRTVRTTCRLK